MRRHTFFVMFLLVGQVLLVVGVLTAALTNAKGALETGFGESILVYLLASFILATLLGLFRAVMARRRPAWESAFAISVWAAAIIALCLS
jgi:hypothetical protein